MQFTFGTLVLIILLLLFFSWLRASDDYDTKLATLLLELLNYGLLLRTADGLICSISTTEASIVYGSESLLLWLMLIDFVTCALFEWLAGEGDFSVNPIHSKTKTVNIYLRSLSSPNN